MVAAPDSNSTSLARQLTEENFRRGFLIDDEWMGGVSETAGAHYAAFVLNHSSAEYVAYQEFLHLGDALGFINSLKRDWSYEATSACGEGKCGEGAQCGTGLCPKTKSAGCGGCS